MIRQALGDIDVSLDKIFSDTVYEEYYGHARSYKLFGREQIPFEQNTQLQELIGGIRQQTGDTFRNMTKSMGFAIKDPVTGKITYSPLMKFYQDTLDAAMWDLLSGGFDFNTILNRTVSRMTTSGIRWIDYDSGNRNRVDVAARRAILTGFRQIQGKINEQVAQELETDRYEVSAHVGARPTHQPWQGRVYTMQQLIDICGLGEIDGLHGINCYHDYQAFPPGSIRTYTDEQLEQMIKEENTPKEYKGKKYTTYEALQKQRYIERCMRKSRQEIKLLKAGEAPEQEIILKKARYQGQLQQYSEFSKTMGLPEQMKRVYQDGLRGKFTPTKTELKKIEPPILKNAAGKDIIEVKRITLTGTPNSITQLTGKKGGIERNYYDENGRQYKQISNNDHGNAKRHPYGNKGEHAHDYVYKDDKLIGRPTRELTENEKKENLDIL